MIVTALVSTAMCMIVIQAEHQIGGMKGCTCQQVVQVVCCRPSQLQVDLYNHFLASNAAQRMLSAAQTKGKASALTAINALRKLCGHPKLIYDLIHPTSGKAPAEADGFKARSPSSLPPLCLAKQHPNVFLDSHRSAPPCL